MKLCRFNAEIRSTASAYPCSEQAVLGMSTVCLMSHTLQNIFSPKERVTTQVVIYKVAQLISAPMYFKIKIFCASYTNK